MNIWQKAERIIEILKSSGEKAYFVGGAVRDMLKGEPFSDIDITTSATPEKIKSLFDKTVDTGIQHGTVTVIYEGDAFEVTTFRKEGDYEGHRKPESVLFVSCVREDLSRRDFTINAMAYNSDEGLIDYFGGKEDLKKGIIRCVGEPQKRFEEDALRMLRAVRFACKTGFEIEDETKEGIIKKAELIKFVSCERIYAELLKAICSPHPEKIRLLYETGLLKFIMPELSLCFETEQNTKFHLFDVGTHILKAVSLSQSDKIVRLSALLHDIAKPLCKTTDERGTDHFKGHEKKSSELAEAILTRLKADNKTINAVKSIILNHRLEKEVDKLYTKQKLIAVGKENFLALLSLMEADTKAHNMEYMSKRLSEVQKMRTLYKEILDNNEPTSIKELCLNGKDVENLGYKGKEVGEILDKALKEVLKNPENNKRDYLIERFKK